MSSRKAVKKLTNSTQKPRSKSLPNIKSIGSSKKLKKSAERKSLQKSTNKTARKSLYNIKSTGSPQKSKNKSVQKTVLSRSTQKQSGKAKTKTSSSKSTKLSTSSLNGNKKFTPKVKLATKKLSFTSDKKSNHSQPSKRSRSLSLPQNIVKVTGKSRSQSAQKPVKNKKSFGRSEESIVSPVKLKQSLTQKLNRSVESPKKQSLKEWRENLFQRMSVSPQSPKTTDSSAKSDSYSRRHSVTSPSKNRMSASYLTGVSLVVSPNKSSLPLSGTDSKLDNLSRRRLITSSPSKSRMSASYLTGVNLSSPNKSTASSFVFPSYISGESTPTPTRKSPLAERLSDIKSPIVRNIKRKLDELSRQEAESAAKQLKEEPPKSLDKKKVAALMKCHGVKQGLLSETSLESSQLKSPESVKKTRSYLGESSSFSPDSASPPYSQVYSTSIASETGMNESRARKLQESGSRSSFDVSGIVELMATPKDFSSNRRESSVKFALDDEDDDSNERILKALDLARKSDLPIRSKDDGPRRSRRLQSSHQPIVYRKTPAKVPLSETKLTEISMTPFSAKKNVSFRSSLVKSPPVSVTMKGVKRKSEEMSPSRLPKSILKRSRRVSPTESLDISDSEIKQFPLGSGVNVTSTPLPRIRPKSRLGRRSRKSELDIFSPELISEVGEVEISPNYSSPAYSELMFNTPDSECLRRSAKSLVSVYSPNQSVRTLDPELSKPFQFKATPGKSNSVSDSVKKQSLGSSTSSRSSKSGNSKLHVTESNSFEFSSVLTPDISNEVFVSTLRSSKSISEPEIKLVSIPEIIISSPSPPSKNISRIDSLRSLRCVNSVNNSLVVSKQTPSKKINTSAVLKNTTLDTRGIRRMFRTSNAKETVEPSSDYSDVKGVRKMFTTPNTKETVEPSPDYSNLRGVRKMFKTPNAKETVEPCSDYSDVKGVRKMFKTPNAKETMEPTPNYSNVKGVRKMFTTPNAKETVEPSPDYSNLRGVRKMFKTPNAKETVEPSSDYSDVKGVRKMFKTPNAKETVEHIPDYSNVKGIKKMFSSPPKGSTSPIADYTNVVGVKKMFASPNKDVKEIEESKADYSNISGVSRLFSTRRSARKGSDALNNGYGNLSGVKELFVDSTSILSSSVKVNSVKKLFDSSIMDLKGARKLFLDGASESDCSVIKQHSPERPVVLTGSRKRKPSKSYDILNKPQSTADDENNLSHSTPKYRMIEPASSSSSAKNAYSSYYQSPEFTQKLSSDDKQTRSVKKSDKSFNNECVALKTESPKFIKKTRGAKIEDNSKGITSESRNASKKTRGAQKVDEAVNMRPATSKPESPKVAKKTRGAHKVEASIIPPVILKPESPKVSKKTRGANKVEEVPSTSFAKTESPKVAKKTRGAKKAEVINKAPLSTKPESPKVIKKTRGAKNIELVSSTSSTVKPESSKVTKRTRGAKKVDVINEAPESPKVNKKTRGTKKVEEPGPGPVVLISPRTGKGGRSTKNLKTESTPSEPEFSEVTKKTRGGKKIEASVSAKPESPTIAKKTRRGKKVDEASVSSKPESSNVAKKTRGKKVDAVSNVEAASSKLESPNIGTRGAKQTEIAVNSASRISKPESPKVLKKTRNAKKIEVQSPLVSSVNLPVSKSANTKTTRKGKKDVASTSSDPSTSSVLSKADKNIKGQQRIQTDSPKLLSKRTRHTTREATSKSPILIVKSRKSSDKKKVEPSKSKNSKNKQVKPSLKRKEVTKRSSKTPVKATPKKPLRKKSSLAKMSSKESKRKQRQSLLKGVRFAEKLVSYEFSPRRLRSRNKK